MSNSQHLERWFTRKLQSAQLQIQVNAKLELIFTVY